MIILPENTLKQIFTELGRTKFNLSNHWHCSHVTYVGSQIEYTMQKINRRGNWGQNTVVGYVDMEKIAGEQYDDKVYLHYF